MKKLLVLMFTVQIATVGVAQAVSYGNFKLGEQEIIFQKVVSQDSITLQKLETYYTSLPYVSNLETKGDELQFTMKDVSVDYKKFQFSQVNTPIILQTGKFTGIVSVSARDGRYRITVKAIQFTGNLGYKMITEPDNLTRYATKNSGTTFAEDWSKPTMLGLLDKAFSDKLEYKQTEEEW
jgi:hypothetical protein